MTLFLKVRYIHYDDGGWKDRFESYVRNPNAVAPEKAEEMIRALTDDGFFNPSRVGLFPCVEGDIHELHFVEGTEIGPANDWPHAVITLDRLLEKMAEANKPPKPVKVPGFVPIRLAVSILEFLRETREALAAMHALCRGKTVMVFVGDDWALLEETLDLDAQSVGFEAPLRRKILKALKRSREVYFHGLPGLIRKGRLLEAKTKAKVL